MSMKALYPMVLLAAFASVNTYAACTRPVAPGDIPQGKSATHEQMLAAYKAVKGFDTATTDYISCLQAEGDAEVARLAEEKDPKKKEKRLKKLQSALEKKQNTALEADKALAARFNEQLRIFKAKSNEQTQETAPQPPTG